MKFFGLLDKAPAPTRAGNRAPKGANVELLHRMECKACPLNYAKCYSPKMPPEGPSEGKTLVYVLGTAPDQDADDADRPWVGREAKLISRAMSSEVYAQSRWNNIVRTFPGMDPKPVDTRDKEGKQLDRVKEPNFAMIEACRPSIVRDIEKEKPEAIFTFGSAALRWVNGETHPSLWAGRRMPVQIGKHKCWLYPFPHPVDVIKERRWEGFEGDGEASFKLFIRRACDEVEAGLPEPVIHTEADARADVVCYDGKGGDDELDLIETFLLREGKKHPVHGLDIETNMKRPYSRKAKMLSFAVSVPGRTIAVALEHSQAKWTKKQLTRLWDILWDYVMMRGPVGPVKAVHSLGFELEWFAVLLDRKIVWGSDWSCTMSQAFCLNETQGLLGLENLGVQYFGINVKQLAGLDRKNLDAAPIGEVLMYNGVDAKYHRQLYSVQLPRLKAEGVLKFQLHHELRPRAMVLSQIKGIPVDQKRVKKYRDQYEPAMAEAVADLNRLKEVRDFNYGKPKEDHYSPSNNNHLAALLRSAGIKLQLTEKGGDQTNVKALKGISHPALEPTLRWRKPAKVLSTYVDHVTEGHPESKLQEDGWAHIIFSHCKVVTSRTSAEEFNVQNWPKRNENRKVREIVVAPPGYKIVSIDYASIQARNIAMESRDAKFITAFTHNYDMHTDQLEKLDRICPQWAGAATWKDKKLVKDARNAVKNQFVFPTFFGARPSPKMVAGIMGVYGKEAPTPEQLAKLQEALFEDFPDVKRWQESMRAMYDEKGYVMGLSGHKRHAPVEYTQIINAPIQADETIIVESAHIALSEIDPDLYAASMMIHDDLTFLFPTKRLDECIDTAIYEMTKVRYDWIDPVPLEVEVSIGDDWGNQEDAGKFKNRPDGKDGYVQISENK